MASEINSGSGSSQGTNLTNEFLTPGEKFGDYQVMQCLSFDLIGGLYRMQNIKNFEEVCIAVLPQNFTTAPEFRERFTEMGKKLKKLQHPNLLQTTGFGQIDNRYAFIMEPFAGANMVEYLETFSEERQKKSDESASDTPVIAQGETKEMLAEQEIGLPAQEIKNVLKQASEALQVAHVADINHLYINPTSFVRASEGQVKITGLGLYELMGQDLYHELVSSGIPTIQIGPRNISINTHEALSPEVLKGKEADINSDFYSLGFSAYFLLTGKKPGEDYLPPSKISARTPQGWDQIIDRCLQVNPTKRYINARALVSDLDKVDRAAISGRGTTDAFSRHIEKIPLPKSLERRLDLKKLKFIRLCIIGFFALLVARMVTLSYSIIFSEKESPTGRIVWLAEVGRSRN